MKKKIKQWLSFLAPSVEGFMLGVAMMGWLAIFYPLNQTVANFGAIILACAAVFVIVLQYKEGREIGSMIVPLTCFCFGVLVIAFLPGIFS